MTSHDKRLLEIAKEGFRVASSNRNCWYQAVNSCPYGPGLPGRDEANAWYRGFWFFFYVIWAWRKCT